jgi:ABC-2 type transport system ATP-binding protein
MNAIEAAGVGFRYGRGRRWALHDCTVSIPCERVVGLVGPNGAGKTTLLQLAVGLLGPTTGTISVLGRPAPRSAEQLARVGFVGQDKPLYKSFRVEEMLDFGRWLNPSWDQRLAAERLRRLRIPLDQRIGGLSGGQQAQVALAVALGKRPELLLLDEPVANLDPLARREFLASVMEDVAESAMTVVLSSHLVADLERISDYLLLLAAGSVQLAGDTENIINAHAVLVGPRELASSVQANHAVVLASYADRQATLLVRMAGPALNPAWVCRPPTLEELVLAYMSRPAVTNTDQPSLSLAEQVSP